MANLHCFSTITLWKRRKHGIVQWKAVFNNNASIVQRTNQIKQYFYQTKYNYINDFNDRGQTSTGIMITTRVMLSVVRLCRRPGFSRMNDLTITVCWRRESSSCQCSRGCQRREGCQQTRGQSRPSGGE